MCATIIFGVYCAHKGEIGFEGSAYVWNEKKMKIKEEEERRKFRHLHALSLLELGSQTFGSFFHRIAGATSTIEKGEKKKKKKKSVFWQLHIFGLRFDSYAD